MRNRILCTALVAIGMGCVIGHAQADDLNLETARLERQSRAGKLSNDDARRLAGIYFLTSRCGDVEKLLKARLTDDTKELICACGGRCASGTRSARLSQLRAALEHSTQFEDRAVQAIWRELSRWPEAQYLVLHYLNSSPRTYRDARLRQLRGELEKSLQSLEVKP